MIYLPTTDAAQNTGGYFRQKLLFPMSWSRRKVQLSEYLHKF
jgi:hypothetical protein